MQDMFTSKLPGRANEIMVCLFIVGKVCCCSERFREVWFGIAGSSLVFSSNGFLGLLPSH